jgi:transcriptional regulator with XRE-family HTH domain
MRKAQDFPVLRAAATEIKARRTSLNISQEELAHRAEVHRSFVARLEVAETQPSLAVLFRLAEALEVEADDLVGSIAVRYRKELRQARRANR